MLISAFVTHKKAEHFYDCQDRFSINSDTKSIAVSDGMSQSIFQKYWAEILVNTFVSKQEWVPNKEAVKELSPIWRNKVEENIKAQKESGNKSVWRAERSLLDGRSAGATFLGIRFHGLNWEGDVLGDSCLIWVNDNRIKKIYTSEDVEAFDSYPDFFDSNPQKEGKGSPIQISGSLKTGDNLLLVSDPLSDFLLKNKGTSEEAVLIDRLLGVNSHQEFEDVVEQWRNKGMHNDDTTLIIVKSDGTEDFTIVKEDDISELINEEKLLAIQNEIQELSDESEIGKDSNIENLNNSLEQETEKLNHPVQEESVKTDWLQVFDNEFDESLNVYIYKHLNGWVLTKGKKREKVFLIAKDIKSLIQHTIRKKCQ